MSAERSRRPRYPVDVLYKIAARDGFVCGLCDGGYRPDDPWVIDHWIPLAAGGTNHLSNLVLMHASCNLAKSDTVPKAAAS